jgi:hypothetical protein
MSVRPDESLIWWAHHDHISVKDATQEMVDLGLWQRQEVHLGLEHRYSWREDAAELEGALHKAIGSSYEDADHSLLAPNLALVGSLWGHQSRPPDDEVIRTLGVTNWLARPRPVRLLVELGGAGAGVRLQRHLNDAVAKSAVFAVYTSKRNVPEVFEQPRLTTDMASELVFWSWPTTGCRRGFLNFLRFFAGFNFLSRSKGRPVRPTVPRGWPPAGGSHGRTGGRP